MNNKPVAWIWSEDGYYIGVCLEQDKQMGKEFEQYTIPLYTHPVKEQKCIVKDCENHKHEGGFVGDLCKPCHQFITTGEGIYSQAYRNSHPVELTDEFIEKLWFKSGAEMSFEDFKELFKAILRKAQRNDTYTYR